MPRSELYSGDEEQDEKPQKSDGDSQGVVQGSAPEEKSSQAEARVDQEIFSPSGKKFPGLLNFHFLNLIMAKAKHCC